MKVPGTEAAGAPEQIENPAVEQTQETAVTETPAEGAIEETPAEEAAPAEGDPAATEETPAFTPNLKFKVMDKEHEIPEFLRGIVKDEKTQKEIVDLLTKAHGLDHAKPKHQRAIEELQTERQTRAQVEERYTQVEQGYARLQGMLKNNDLQSFMEFWKIPKENLLRHAAELLRYEEMSPEERAQVDQHRSARAQAESHGLEAQRARQAAYTAQGRVREMELDTAISRADIAAIAQQYDTKAGKPGKFKERVIRTAKYHALSAQKDISVEEAIQETMAELGFELGDEETPQAAPAKPPAQKVVASVAQKKLPVIPASGASGASPVKKTFTSVEELVAHRESLAQQKNG